MLRAVERDKTPGGGVAVGGGVATFANVVTKCAILQVCTENSRGGGSCPPCPPAGYGPEAGLVLFRVIRSGSRDRRGLKSTFSSGDEITSVTCVRTHHPQKNFIIFVIHFIVVMVYL